MCKFTAAILPNDTANDDVGLYIICCVFLAPVCVWFIVPFRRNYMYYALYQSRNSSVFVDTS